VPVGRGDHADFRRDHAGLLDDLLSSAEEAAP
jgi:hypothetical protein